MRKFLVLTAALALCGCGGAPSLQLAPVTGGVLSLSLVGDPATFNPALARRGGALELSRQVFVGLMSLDDTGQWQPELAERSEMLDGGRRFRVTLRPELRWSDNEPLTARDVVYSFERVWRDPRAQMGLDSRLQLRSEGDRIVEFVLAAPQPDFAQYLGLPVLPAHALGENDPFAAWGLDIDPTTLPGNGPFLYRRYLSGERIDLAANPRYWRSSEQQPYLAGMRYRIVPDASAATALFEAGETDALLAESDSYASLAARRSEGRYSLVSGGAHPPVYLAFNLNPPGKNALLPEATAAWFASRDFRQGVALALDRPQLVDRALFGLGEATGSRDSAQARAKLSAAGLRPGPDNRLADASGNPVQFELLVNADDPAEVRLGEVVSAQLAEVGLLPQIVPVPRLVLRNRLLRSGRWQAAIADLEDLGAPAAARGGFWQSSSPWHFFNKSGSTYPWEQQLDAALAAPDPAERANGLAAVLAAETPVIELVRPLAVAAVRDGVLAGRFGAAASAETGRIFANIWQVQKAPSESLSDPADSPAAP